MKKYLLIILLFTQSLANASDSYQAIAEEARNNIPQQTALYKQDAEKALLAAESLTKNYKRDAIFAGKQEKSILITDQQDNHKINGKKKNPSILIFISFSMPERSIEAYLRDAKKIHASVVIRGLIDNSFQKTFQRMATLVKSSGGDGVELNPIWFKRFNIKTVPAVVVVGEDSPCFQNNTCQNDRDFDVITGDITLASALRMIRDRGITKGIAQSALEKLQESSYA
jgi:type-F conjugative transfer system pilin assembly protein TrbC